MLIAVTIELALTLVVLASSDWRTRLLGTMLLTAYAYYSASWAAVAQVVRRLIKDWDDRNNPPPGAA